MKSLLTILAIFLALSPKREERANFVVESCSKFVIEGKTNVHQFNCVFDTYKIPEDTFSIAYYTQNNQIQVEDALISLPVRYFDCGIKMMNRDLQELLKSEEYPNVDVKIKNLYLQQDSTNYAAHFVSAEVLLTIASVCQTYYMNGITEQHGDDLAFDGSLCIQLTDFNLEPPKKALGLVKVDNSITIDLNVTVHKI